jgi:hypothetical protein
MNIIYRGTFLVLLQALIHIWCDTSYAGTYSLDTNLHHNFEDNRSISDILQCFQHEFLFEAVTD